MGILASSSPSSPVNFSLRDNISRAAPRILTRECALHFIIALISNRAHPLRLLASATLLLSCFVIPQASSYYYYRRSENDPRVVGVLLPFALISVAPSYSHLLLSTSLTCLLFPFNGLLLTLFITSSFSSSYYYFTSSSSLHYNTFTFIAAAILVPAISAFVLCCAPNSFTSTELSLVACGASIMLHLIIPIFLSHHAVSTTTFWSIPIAAASMAALLSLFAALISCRMKKLKRTRSLIPYLILGVAIVPTYMFTYYYLLNGSAEPIRWFLFSYIFASSRNLLFIAYWALVLLLGLTIFHPSKFVYQYGRTTARKIFHLYAIFIYVPAIYYDTPQFLTFASLLAFSILCILDSLPFINPFEHNLLDTRDTASIALTHLYLLVGITAPISIANNNNNMGQYAGIISLGVMDSVAAVVGSKYGTSYWNNGFGRTIEGSLASVAFMLAVLAALRQLTAVAAVSVVMVALLEAHSSEIDNIILPLYFLASLNAW